MIRAIFFLFFAAFLVSQASFAEDLVESFEMDGRIFTISSAITQKTRNVLREDIEALKKMHLEELSDSQLDKIGERISLIKVVFISGEPLIGSGYRNGAVNLAKEHYILYNYDKTKTYSLRQKTINRWHEALGAMGFDDENGLLSTMIAMRLTQPAFTLNPVIQNNIKKQINQPLIEKNKTFRNFRGGISGVGGGGDGVMSEVRWVLISYLNRLAYQGSLGSLAEAEKIIQKAIDTPVENIELISQYSSSFAYRKLHIGINNFTAQISILIDPKDWDPIIDKPASEADVELLNSIIDILIRL